MNPNIENLQKLKDWLLAGAPHAYFNMRTALTSTDDVEVKRHTYFATFDDYLKETGQAPKPDCGTICCIGGAAYLMSKALPGQSFAEVQDDNREWWKIRNDALEFLGLPRGTTTNDDHMGHDLFDHELAPEDCTPQRAAQAVQNVMEGKAPWN